MISSDPSRLLELRGLTVCLDNRVLLDDVNLTVERGDIHAIMGDRGSGKTALIHMISGMLPKTRGAIVFEGNVIERLSPKRAVELGIETIHQEMVNFPNRSVFENVFPNKDIRRNVLVRDRKAMANRALDLFKEFSVDIDLEFPLFSLTESEQQVVEIVKGLCFYSKLLLVDEISPRLSPKKFEKLQYLLSVIRQKGTTILYIPHAVEEVFNFASKVSVMRNGHIVETKDISRSTSFELVQLTYSSMFNRQELEKHNLELFYLKNFYENTIDNFPLPLAITDSAKTIVFANKIFCRLMSRDRDSLIGKPVMSFFPIPDEIWHRVINQIRSIEEPGFVSVESNSEKGTRGAEIFPFYNDESFMGAGIVFKDVTGMAAPSGRGADWPDKSASLEKIGSGIAHEINNPLGIILNYLELIKSGSSVAKIHENALSIEREVKRIKRILHSTFGDAKLFRETGADTQLHSILAEVMDLLKPTIEKNDINLSVSLKNDVCLGIDADLLKQVILNLVLNAVEAMPEGGDLEIRSKDHVSENRKYSVLEFTDSGAGIPRDDLPHVFEPFYSTKNDDEHKGLGLSISRDIMEKCGGFITVDSAESRGATFRVYLPCGSR